MPLQILRNTGPHIPHHGTRRLSIRVLSRVVILLAGIGLTPAIAATTSESESDAAPVCDSWLGDYAIRPDQIAVLRIEKDSGGYTLRHRQMGGSHPWLSYTDPMIVLPEDRVRAAIPEAHGCVLRSDAGTFARIDDKEISQTGFLLIRSEVSRAGYPGPDYLDLYYKPLDARKP